MSSCVLALRPPALACTLRATMKPNIIGLRIKELCEEKGATVEINEGGKLLTVPVTNASRLGRFLGIASSDQTIPLFINQRLDKSGAPMGEPPKQLNFATLQKICDAFGLGPDTPMGVLFDFPQTSKAARKKGATATQGKTKPRCAECAANDITTDATTKRGGRPLCDECAEFFDDFKARQNKDVRKKGTTAASANGKASKKRPAKVAGKKTAKAKKKRDKPDAAA